jgi:hypothetical protein
MISTFKFRHIKLAPIIIRVVLTDDPIHYLTTTVLNSRRL